MVLYFSHIERERERERISNISFDCSSLSVFATLQYTLFFFFFFFFFFCFFFFWGGGVGGVIFR